ncbi:MAG TPA: hypothetical protein VGG45_16365 [Terracidiphilus sp.]|jgi:hypothetical protein
MRKPIGVFCGALTFIWGLGVFGHYWMDDLLPHNGGLEQDPWWGFPGFMSGALIIAFISLVLGAAIALSGNRK